MVLITDRFAYFPYDLALAFGEYIFLILICLYLRHRWVKHHEFHFECVFGTILDTSKYAFYYQIIQLISRLGFFIFFLIFAGALIFAKGKTDYQYFTAWYVCIYIYIYIYLHT